MDHHRATAPARRSTRRRISAALVVALAVVALVGSCTARPLGRRPAAKGPADVAMVFPIGREVSFSDTFGAPRSGGRTHQGQDLMAPKMTPLVAAADGTITWMRHTNDGNAGNYLVLTDAAGWEYWYLHMNNDTPGADDGRNRYDQAFADGIRKGQRVKAGELLGWVGDSGNAEGSGSHLHFELKAPDDRTVNPFNSLAAAQLYTRTPADAAAAAPFGNTELVGRGAGGLAEVRGWAIDRHVNTAVWVSVYVNGTPVAEDQADVSRPDVGAAHPGRGERHGFTFSGVAVPPGATVCVVAHSVGGGGGTRLGCWPLP